MDNQLNIILANFKIEKTQWIQEVDEWSNLSE